MFNIAHPYWRIGTVADPGPELLLAKDKLAKLRIKKLDMAINDLKQQIDILTAERMMLVKEYKIR